MLDAKGLPPMHMPTISPFHPESIGSALTNIMSLASSVNTADLAHYYPFTIYSPVTVYDMFYIVGATSNGNIDLGIYDSQLNRIVNSGSTGMGTANTFQIVPITDTLLVPGDYFMAYQASSGTGTTSQRSGAADQIPLIMKYTQAVGSFGLPATATLSKVSLTGTFGIQLFGLILDSAFV